MQNLPNNFACPRCRNVGTYAQKKFDSLVTVGPDTLVVADLLVEECRVCHEQLLNDAATRRVETLAEQLRTGNKQSFVPIGTTYRATT